MYKSTKEILTPTLSAVIERRDFGVHLTSVDIFKNFILPDIKGVLYNYSWVDLFGGEGNLILPILDLIPATARRRFFEEHIFIFDIQEDLVKKAIANAQKYGIPYELAKKNIQIRDTLKEFPSFIKELKYPAYHITNPPYLYLGYIVKNSERNLKYFLGPNEGYQDLYQVALINDLRNSILQMVYIIPTNFLFGFSVSNKIRNDLLFFYNIKKAIIFEKKIFEFTGTNVCICFFERKKYPMKESLNFEAVKINNKTIRKIYHLSPDNSYRAGSEFDEFTTNFETTDLPRLSFYLTLDEVAKNKGQHLVSLVDANAHENGFLKSNCYKINNFLYKKIKNNPLFIRTVDTGRWEGRAGIYNVKELFGKDGIVVTKEKYRTHPIQIFFMPEISNDDLNLFKDYFNLMLEHFRNITDSEFLTTFKYSNSEYIRKYLGLSQVRRLIETLPINAMSEDEKANLRVLIEIRDADGIKDFLCDFQKRTFMDNMDLFEDEV